MRDVADLNVTQYYLFGPGRVPYAHLATRQALDALQEAFQFRDVNAFPGAEVGFEGGVASVPKSGKVTIRRMQVSDRRIIVDVAGSSDAAAGVFDLLRQQVAPLDPTDRFAAAQPIQLRQDTTCTATLDVPWEGFFNPALVRFLAKRFEPAASDESARVDLHALTLRFTYTYQVESPTVSKYGIALAPKSLIVEPVVDTPLDERRYFTASPTDSATHLVLLAELEKILQEREV